MKENASGCFFLNTVYIHYRGERSTHSSAVRHHARDTDSAVHSVILSLNQQPFWPSTLWKTDRSNLLSTARKKWWTVYVLWACFISCR